MAWTPPSPNLQLQDGIWQPKSISAVSYPSEGNDCCFQIEDGSYWFSHRNDCILALLSQFPPDGDFYDIGGGNGFVSLSLQKAGIPSVLVEPGNGVYNARQRGLDRVIHAALEDTGFAPDSLPAAGAFDVIEHIDDDIGFLRTVHRFLRPGGRFYGTVPAGPVLWSNDDVFAGHYRRHSASSITDRLSAAGFEVEFTGYFFSWLALPILLLRTLPFRLRGNKRTILNPSFESARRDHHLPSGLSGVVETVHGLEISAIRSQLSLPIGSSLIFSARKARSAIN